MKKTGMIALITGGLIALGGGSVYASNQIAKSASITEEAATNFALVDAKVKPEEATITRVKFDFEDGRFVYEVDFRAGDTKYDYTVDSQSGEIVGKESEVLSATTNAKPAQSAQATAQKPAPAKQEASPANNTPAAKDIGVDSAKEIALANAGLGADAVVFSKAYQDWEDGTLVYEIEFLVPGVAEYDYEIDAATGRIRVAETERVETVTPAPQQPAQPAPAQPAPQPAQQPAPPTITQPAPAQGQYWDDDWDDAYDDWDDAYDDWDDAYDDWDDVYDDRDDDDDDWDD